jgi:methyl-accepting chemotaxis protein
MRLSDIRIGRKLGGAFAILVAAIAIMGVFQYASVNEMREAGRVKDRSEAIMATTQEAQFFLSRQENSYRGYLISLDPYYIERVDKHRGNFKARLAKLRDLFTGDETELSRLAKLETAADSWYDNVVVKGSRLAQSPETKSQATDMVGPTGTADGFIEPAETAIDQIMEVQAASALAAVERQTNAANRAFVVLLAGIGAAALIAIALGITLTRTIALPVNAMSAAMRRLQGGDNAVEVPAIGRKDELGEMAQAVMSFKDAAIAKDRLERETALERARNEEAAARSAAEQAAVVDALAAGLAGVAQGDLTRRLTQTFPPAYLKLQNDFNAALAQLQDAMRAVVSNVGGMKTGTGEITQAADDLSQRTERQAAALEETAAALDEITATVSKTATGARQANVSVVTARDCAERGGDIVNQTVAAMGEIDASSREISQIIGVIDEIAFQTNLLALNAGVEAARAGDAGRGFAVVASEVRSLAQRSADAARQIKALISKSSSQVETGVKLAGESGRALLEISSRVGEVSVIVAEIAASVEEQAAALHQVNSAINQMDQTTQQNAAMVEETTAASHSLAQEADELAGLVARFDVGEAVGQLNVMAQKMRRNASPSFAGGANARRA